ncbi:MAG: C_GCAxxG_C_C family protein [Desulfuromonadales bacterium]|nr:MAG: C_GCAxxG_C_C family protein [Desulfuromonadales bacterium]
MEETFKSKEMSRRQMLKATAAAGALIAAGGIAGVAAAAETTPALAPKLAERPEKASKRFMASMNCSQAICEVYGPSLGLSAEVAGRIGTGFAGGMGLGSECGAATGAVAILGLKYGPDTGKTMAKVGEFMVEFRKRCGDTSCSKLLKVDMGTPEGVKAAADKGLFTTACPGFVRTAGEILEKMLA